MYKNETLLYPSDLLNIFVIMNLFLGLPLLGAAYCPKYKGGHISKRAGQKNSFLCIMCTRHTTDDESMTNSAGSFNMP